MAKGDRPSREEVSDRPCKPYLGFNLIMAKIVIAAKKEQTPPTTVDAPIAIERGSVELNAWVERNYPGHLYVCPAK